MSEVILIQPKDLREMIAEAVRLAIQNVSPKETREKKYLTREEVSELLRVSLVTLHSWNTKGILTPIKIEGRVLYPAHSVEALVKRKRA